MSKIKWKVKKDASIGDDFIYHRGFWSDLVDGKINPEEILEDKFQIKALEDAINVVSQFETMLWEKNIYSG